MKPIQASIKGRIKLAVVNNGQTIMETGWLRNLWLDQGLDNFATKPFCQLFEVAVKGKRETIDGTYSQATTTVTRDTGTRDFTADDIDKTITFFNGVTAVISAILSTSTVTVSPSQSVSTQEIRLSVTPTVEVVPGANTYSITSGTSTLTRAAGTRNFTADDVGKLIRFTTTPFAEFHITAINSVSSVEVAPSADATVTTEPIDLHSVHQVDLTQEVGRTDTYSSVSGENGTVTADNEREFTRTFLFPTEDDLVEIVPVSNTYSQSGTTVIRESGTRDFTTADIGATILFIDSGEEATINAITNVDEVEVDESQTNGEQNIQITLPNDALVEEPAGSNTYSRAGTTVTRAAGTRDFTLDDVGKYIHFITSNVETKITAFTSATQVTVDVSGVLAAQNIILYGFTDYEDIGFSHSMEREDNLNVRIKLGSAVRVYHSTDLRASDQLKVTYECTLEVEPDTSTPGSLASIISDPGNLMSGNKNGDYVIESFATSTVLTNGDTDITFPDLEPFSAGYAALSQSAEVLDPLSNIVRSTATAYVPFEAQDYVDGSFLRDYIATFGLNDANGTTWRTLMLYDPDSQSAIFTFRYDTNQKKDGEHTFEITLRKSWTRDLA